MKIILMLIILSAAICHAAQITYDPNDITVGEKVLIPCVIELSLQEYKAMNILDLKIRDIFKLSRFVRVFERLIEQAKAILTRDMTLNELEAMARREG